MYETNKYMNSLLLQSNGIIANTRIQNKSMPTYIDISKYWDKSLSVNQVFEDLIKKDRKIDRKSLTAAIRGTLIRCDASTLENIRDLARDLSGNKNLAIEDILVKRKA